jgi:GTP-binding protein
MAAMSGFVDEAQIHAKAGDGGAGAVSFRREAHVDRGGPDGGDGGRGGDVWMISTPNQASLLGFRDHPHRRATDGGHGSGKRRHGARGADLLVPVPVGTVVRARDGSVLCDLSGSGDRWLAAEGGRGGRGNARFLSNKRRAPAFAEQGEHGQERWLEVELKLVADVALVGFPNVGKSTLISAVSAAKPKVADYPFTTLQPHLGVVRVAGRAGRPGDDDVELVMADVPGLVEGAADGRGLGHRFLRHVERARGLLFLLDLAPADGTSPEEQLRVLLGELARYRPELLDRRRLVVGSKADLLTWQPAGRTVDLVVSAVTGRGIPDLLHRLAQMVTDDRAAEAAEAASGGLGETVVHRPVPEGVRVYRLEPGVWVAAGREAERAVSFSDLTDDGALVEAVRRLRRLGVDRSLARAGARDGDEVRVGEISFSWYRDRSDGGLDLPEADDRRSGGRDRRRDRRDRDRRGHDRDPRGPQEPGVGAPGGTTGR